MNLSKKIDSSMLKAIISSALIYVIIIAAFLYLGRMYFDGANNNLFSFKGILFLVFYFFITTFIDIRVLKVFKFREWEQLNDSRLIMDLKKERNIGFVVIAVSTIIGICTLALSDFIFLNIYPLVLLAFFPVCTFYIFLVRELEAAAK